MKAEIEAAVRSAGVITIPVTPVVANTGAASAQAGALAAVNSEVAASNTAVAETATAAAAATNQKAAADTKAAAASTRNVAATRSASEAERQLVLSRRAVAAGERQVLATTSEIAGARVRLNAANRALTRAELAYEASLGSQRPLLIGNADATRRLALARQAAALAAFQAADASATLASQEAREAAAANASAAAQARRTAGLGKGAAATALSAAGARGATLAASGPFLVGAAATVGILASLKASADLTVQLNVLRVTAEATEAEMAQISETARQLGADISLPGVSATDAAQAMTELTKAGLDVQDSIEGARGVLQLATAAGIDNAAATELAASALNSFGLAGAEATHVADVFANAANQSQGSIVDIGTAFQQAAAVARLAGVSFEDTASLLTLLARNGLQGSDAGTSLRTAFIRLINPTKEAAELLSRMNIEIRDVEGNVRPEVFAEFAAATRDMGRAQQDAATAIVFGQDAIRAASILGREGVAGFDATSAALDKTGTAAELAAAKAVGLSGALSKLSNDATNLGTTIGNKLSGPAEGFVNALDHMVVSIDKVIAGVEALGGGGDDGEKTFKDLTQAAADARNELDNFSDGGNNAEITQRTLQEAANDTSAALRATLGPGVDATDAIEGYRAGNAEAANAAQGLNNRLDESADRFAHVARTVDGLVKSLSPVQAAFGQIAGFQEAADRARAAGDRQGELSALRGQAERNRRIIAEAGPDAQGDTLKQRRQAQKDLAANKEQITSIEQSIASEAKQAATEQARIREDAAREQVRIRTEADRKVIAAIETGRRPLDLRQITADDTETLKDNIALARDRKQFLQETINIVRTSIKDDKLRADTIASLVEERKRVSTEIGNLLEDQANATKIAAQDAANQRTENLAKATRIAELRGNDAAILRGYNAQIANARKRIAAAKKAKAGVLDEQVALEELLAARRDLIDKTKEGKEQEAGDFTSAFDLLTGAAETFRATGGNLIGGNQPFAGPTGFTADLAQFLRRQQPQAVRVDTTDVAGRAIERQISSLDRLSDVIEQDIASRTGNTPAGVAASPGSLRDRWNQQRYNYNPAQARKIVEGRIVR